MKNLSRFKVILMVFVLVFAVSTLFTACGATEKAADGTTTTNSTSALSGAVSVVGSTSVAPLAQELADAFSEVQKDVKVDIQGVGSTAGIKAISDGTCDVGISSRELTTEEAGSGLTEHIIALDGIAVIVHPSNGVTDLTKAQIAKIFKGEIKNWKEVGGADKEILVIAREDGSGTKGAFEELLKLSEKQGDKTISLVRSDAQVATGNGEVKANIASNESAIGYLSLGMIDSSIKFVKVDGIEPSVDNVKNKSYTISRPFLMLTKGTIKPEVQAFLDYILSDAGQKVVSKDYITVK